MWEWKGVERSKLFVHGYSTIVSRKGMRIKISIFVTLVPSTTTNHSAQFYHEYMLLLPIRKLQLSVKFVIHQSRPILVEWLKATWLWSGELPQKRSVVFFSSGMSRTHQTQRSCTHINTETILHRGLTESIKNILKTMKLTENASSRKGNSYSLKRGKWRARALVNAPKIAKIRSNVHTSQHAASVPSDHGQGQALVKPLSLPGVTWHVNEFLCKSAQKRGSGLIIQTSGFDCNWLKAIIASKPLYFRHFSVSASVTILPGIAALTMQWLSAKVSTTVASHTRLLSLY